MNNNIQEAYCSFEVSKFLKEKGFDAKCRTYWRYNDKPWIYPTSDFLSNSDFEKACYKHLSDLSAPTHALAIEWMWKNFKLSIETCLDIPQSGEQDGCYVWKGVIKSDTSYKIRIIFATKNLPTKEKATEVALLHVLQNLI